MRIMTRRLGRREALLFGVGFVPSVLYGYLPEVIRQFREAHQEVEVVLTELTTFEQMIALKEARIDIGFGRLRFDDPAIQREVLQEERLVAVLPVGHPLQQRSPPLRLSDLAPEPLILYPKAPRPSYADQVLSCYRDHGLEPRIAYEVREMQTALSLVAAGFGICLVPSAVRRMKRDGLAYAELLGDSLSSPIIMSWRVGDQSHLLTRFCEITRQSRSDRKLAGLRVSGRSHG
jgi:DNA-binding transcriptional LysR family regulator